MPPLLVPRRPYPDAGGDSVPGDAPLPPPVKTLHLLRHAKSAKDRAGVADHDRPLTSRGRRAADRLGAHLRGAGVAPELVLSSSARRARETLDRLRLEPEELRIEGALYGATAEELLDRLRTVPEAVGSALLVGHNPAIHRLALTLAGDEAAVDRLHRFPTGALVTFDLPTPTWADLPAPGRLRTFVTPADLE